jgi:hypothetical protein
MMRHVVIAAASVAALACEPPPAFELSAVEFAGPPGSGEPNLAVTTRGDVALTWFERRGADNHALMLAVRSDGRWNAPMTVAEDREFFVNWADFPSFVALGDGTWAVHWLEKSGPGTYAYHVKVALSSDRGVTWSEPIVPHRDSSETEHGFVSLVPFGEGAAAVWLDGRNMGAGEAGEVEDAHGMGGGAMTIRFTTVAADGTLGPDVLLDERACECCQTALVRTASGLVAAYRDRSPEEIRDIAVVRYSDGAWSEPARVAEENWHIPGCPVNGPQLSAIGDTVAIAWYSAADNVQRVSVAFSTDAGATWSAPVRVDAGDPAGRVDIELLDGDAAVVVWLERAEGETADIRARRVTREGTVDRPWTMASTHSSRGSGFPRMMRVRDELIFAWTRLGDDGGVRVASAK